MTESLDHRDLTAERFGVPAILTEVRCRTCYGLVCVEDREDGEERYVHVRTGSCSRAVPIQVEVSR